MSRLDSFIRRLEAQRACLNLAAALIADMPGPALEIGLGNGRTYDHLRSLLPGRPIFAFDRQIAAHPDCVPDGAHMIVGDFRETLPPAATRIGAPAALAHCDIGSGDRDATAALAAWLAPALPPLLRQGAVVASDQPLEASGLAALGLPAGVAPGRYFLYRKESPGLNDAGPRDWVAVLKSRRHSGATALLGMEPLELDAARGRARVAYVGDVRFTNRAGVVQGGVLCAMLDEGMALAAVVMDDFKTFVPTLELKVNFLAPAKPGRFVVEGQVVRKGRSVGFIEGRLFDEAGDLVATASATVRVVAREKMGRR